MGDAGDLARRHRRQLRRRRVAHRSARHGRRGPEPHAAVERLRPAHAVASAHAGRHAARQRGHRHRRRARAAAVRAAEGAELRVGASRERAGAGRGAARRHRRAGRGPGGAAAAAASAPARIEILATNAHGAPNVAAVNVLRAEFQGIKELDEVYVALHLAQAQKLIFGAADAAGDGDRAAASSHRAAAGGAGAAGRAARDDGERRSRSRSSTTRR